MITGEGLIKEIENVKPSYLKLSKKILQDAIEQINNITSISFVCNYKMWQEIQWEMKLKLNERNPGYNYYYKYHQKIKIHEFRFYKEYKQNVEFREYYNEKYERII